MEGMGLQDVQQLSHVYSKTFIFISKDKKLIILE